MLLNNKLTCFVVEELEPLILHSADINPLAAELGSLSGVTSNQSNFTTISSIQNQSFTVSSNSQLTQRQEVVFIDSGVKDNEQLASEIMSQQNENRIFHVVILDTNKSGIEQINSALNVYKNLDAIHIISHGQAGEILIGDTKLGSQNLLDNAVAISQWGGALNASGDILLYGCDVAEGGEGEEFINQLGQLTGADVAASKDLTGATELGGDWLLESVKLSV